MTQDIINTVVLGCIYVLFAVGMSMVWGTTGILNFAHGSIFMFSAFVGYLIVRDVRLPFVALVAIGIGVGMVLSVLIDVLAFQPIMRRAPTLAAGELQILIGGIGIASILVALAQRETLGNPFGFTNSSFVTEVYQIGAIRISNIQIIAVVTTVVLTTGVIWWLRSSQSGLGLRSIGVDPETAGLMGVDRRRLSLAAMAAAGGLAGLGGVLLTFHLSALDPSSGDRLVIKAFAAIVLGGLGSVPGTVLACFILAASETIVLTQTSGSWVDAVSFGLIFIMLLVRPQGLLGRREVRRA
jgi:branched-chain amino acid transport system permease protein